jgi:hypothetical protein
MCGAIPPLPQYASMAWCLVEKNMGNLILTYRILNNFSFQICGVATFICVEENSNTFVVNYTF